MNQYPRCPEGQKLWLDIDGALDDLKVISPGGNYDAYRASARALVMVALMNYFEHKHSCHECWRAR